MASEYVIDIDIEYLPEIAQRQIGAFIEFWVKYNHFVCNMDTNAQIRVGEVEAREDA
jgi:hypothetical protein